MGHWGVQRRPNQPGKPRRASHSGIQETNTYSSTTQSRPVTRTHSCTISTKYSASYLPPEASNLSDYYSTLCSNKATKFYEEHHCSNHESSTPYQHWQNAVERDIQTILCNVSTTIQSQDCLLRADTRAHALTHWTRLHNALPHSTHPHASSTRNSAPSISTNSYMATYDIHHTITKGSSCK